jgi:hypothetical protein
LTTRPKFRINPHASRSGETGKRSGLKIRRAQALVGSIPTSGTNNIKGLSITADPLFFSPQDGNARGDAGTNDTKTTILRVVAPRFKDVRKL